MQARFSRHIFYMGIDKHPRNASLNNINIRVAVASRCNLKCIYCEGSVGFRPGKPSAMQDFRRKSLEAGDIDARTLLDIIKLFHDEGFIGITLTGGEPLLNPEWDYIVRGAAEIGMSRTELTTNGTLLTTYLNKTGKLPKELTAVKISLDTFDPIRFKELTGGGDIGSVIGGVRTISPQVRTRANKVLLQTDMSDLMNYLNHCQEVGFQEVSLLDLAAYPNRYSPSEKDFFEREYVSFKQVKNYLINHAGIKFYSPHRYGYEAKLPSGLRILMKDSELAVRTDQCLDCPVYCQEGMYTVWIGSDGNITTCPDYKAELPSIDGPVELKRGILASKIHNLAVLITSSKRMESLDKFFRVHRIQIQNKV